jgi:hypothetical protein
VNRLLPGMSGPLGFFLLDLLTPLGIVVWIGYAFSLWYASHFSLESTVFLPLVALACTGLIVAGYFRSFPATNAFYAAVNRTRSFSFYWVYTRLYMRTCAAGDTLRAPQENLQYSEAQFHQPILQTDL